MTVLWDWNGTLIADVPHVVNVNNLVFAAHGYRDTTAEEYRRLFRFPVRDYYLEYGVSEEDFPVIAREWNRIYIEGFGEVPLAPHVPETVKRFQKAGFRQVILSASQIDQLRDQVVRFRELDGIFDEVLGIGDVYASSKVQIAKDYLSRSGVDPADAVFIGDTSHDAEVARAIGVRCLLISGGHQNDEVLNRTGATVLRSLTEAVELLGA
ncbi:MAG: HAD family hydrolase [Christensenellaceae bacterium]|nr:HAD family hydrolase [Christensenellaceae bacterium]